MDTQIQLTDDCIVIPTLAMLVLGLFVLFVLSWGEPDIIGGVIYRLYEGNLPGIEKTTEEHTPQFILTYGEPDMIDGVICRRVYLYLEQKNVPGTEETTDGQTR